MNKVPIHILLFSLMLISFVTDILAQEKSILSETNLSDKITKPNTATTDGSQSQESSSPLKTTKELTNILPKQNRIDSLMFDNKESDSIDHIIGLLKNNQIYGNDESEKDDMNKKDIQENNLDITKNDKEKTKAHIYLGSIIYLNDKEWAVWINDKKVTPESNSKDKEIYLKSVERDLVKVLWTPSVSKWKILLGQKSEGLSPKINANNQVEMEFDLKPNQSFLLRNNAVIEGIGEQITKTENSAAAIKSSKTNNQKSNKNNFIDSAPDDNAEKPISSSDQSDSSNNSNINKNIGTITDKLRKLIPTTSNETEIPESGF